MSQGFQDITWLAGQVFLFRDFVKRIEEKGLDAVFTECPYGDLTGEQQEAFEAAFDNPRLRKVVEQWWAVYDEARAADEIPVTVYWR